MFKRIRNLWRLSAVEIPKVEGPIEKVMKSIEKTFTSKQATIVSMTDPLAEFEPKDVSTP
jgi:hypothetical protein